MPHLTSIIEERKIISGKAANSWSKKDQTRRYLMIFKKPETGLASTVPEFPITGIFPALLLAVSLQETAEN